MIVARRAAILAATLVLAGCGPNNAPAPTAPLATPAPVTSAPAPAGAAAPPAAPAAAQPVVQYYLPAAAGTALAVTNTNLDTGLNAGDHAPGKQGQYAFDFGTDKNVPFTVVAARPGKVLGLQRGSTTQCKDLNTDADGTNDPGCWAKANYVLVDQGDHTAGLYMHLAPDSVPAGLQVGSPVCLGTPLGTDGQTGWATGPHVHFQVEATPTVPAPTAANPGVTDPNAIRPGWWWADSQKIAQGFSDPDVLAKAPSGIPPRGSYTSGNPGIGCPGDAAPPAAPAITASWVAPRDGAKLTTSTLTLSAKPTVTPSTIQVAKVAFSITWGSTTKAACSATRAGSGGVWSCKADLWKLGAPLGRLTLSFDVTDSAGDVAQAPAGTRAATFAAAPPAPFQVSASEDFVTPPVYWNGSAIQEVRGVVRWKSSVTAGVTVRVYGAPVCLVYANQNTPAPCAKPATSVPLSQLDLIGSAPAAKGQLSWLGWSAAGAQPWHTKNGEYYALVLVAVNAAGVSSRVVL